MKSRLRLIIEIKTGGNQAEFGSLMGWSPQYLCRMLRGDTAIGLRPVITMLAKLPDLNARWLILGQGCPFTTALDAASSHLHRLQALAPFTAAMTPSQLRLYTQEGFTDFPSDDLSQWASLLAQQAAQQAKNKPSPSDEKPIL